MFDKTFKTCSVMSVKDLSKKCLASLNHKNISTVQQICKANRLTVIEKSYEEEIVEYVGWKEAGWAMPIA